MMMTGISELRVLLVEPSAVQRQIICRMLEASGVGLTRTAASGEEALHELDESPPGLVISAFYLPDMTGADLILHLRADNDLFEVPFMLVSSEQKFLTLDPIRQAGPSAILRKPFQQADMDEALMAALAFVNADEVAEESDGDFEALRVLVVDDTKVARKFIARTLSRLGIRHLVEASDGVEAVKEIEQQTFDLVVTDYNMPEMDGVGLVEFIRQESYQASVPVIMVTSEDDEERLRRAHEAGASAICDKPFEVNHIRDLIRDLVAD